MDYSVVIGTAIEFIRMVVAIEVAVAALGDSDAEPVVAAPLGRAASVVFLTPDEWATIANEWTKLKWN